MLYFPEVTKIAYEETKSKNPFSIKHENPDDRFQAPLGGMS